MFAIIKTGGKQYKVSEGTKLKIEKLSGEEGDKIEFDQVLLVSEGETVTIGKPLVEGAVVKAKITRQARDRKVIVFHYKSKTRQRTKSGHRQHFTEVEITQISA